MRYALQYFSYAKKKILPRTENGLLVLQKPPMRAFQIVVLAFLLIAIVIPPVESLIVTGPFIFVFGGLWALTYTGVKIDPHKKKLKEFSRFYGFIEFGDWKSISKYRFLTILRSRKRTRYTTRYGAEFSTGMHHSFQLVLLGENHRRKLVLLDCDTMDEAKMFLNILKEKLNLPYAKYNPKRIS